ncbi:MalY/PatB family protein [Runella slithyformis]|uniref:cysteine-S-conjugate beta-lyase n=1 Tax=Runella slithyformis (strain ATCC 29530 / DSM 19594 / LMG 11500 / NCIMB 11436 / LSU 4) TaxID=761193 RepID=A0A7U3ZPG3_RUNSL|nr:PatB family C-S lyase [Runella slithyformis]AEI50959.1 Cystathionine beta-lyase [Runella slithyformis DSM 19594]
MSLFDKEINRRHTNSYKWDKYPESVLPVWVADMDFQAAPPILEALNKITEHGIFGYASCPDELNEVVIERLRTRHEWQIQKQWMVWLGGLVPAIGLAIRAFAEEGEAVMTAVPVYHPFMIEIEMAGRDLQKVPLQLINERWTLDFEAIEAAITPSTKLFLLCNPHNPVGTMFTRKELQRLHDICRRHGIIVCSDEIHCDLVLDNSKEHITYPTLGPEAAQSSLTLLAPSKTFNLAGLGCSLVVIPNDELRAKFMRTKAGLMPMLSSYAYEAALAAYRDGAEWHAELLTYLKGNHDLLLETVNQMTGIKMRPLEATYLAWIDVRGTGLTDVPKRLEEAGVGINDGAIFGEPGFIRLNFACTRATLEEVLRRMKTVFV